MNNSLMDLSQALAITVDNADHLVELAALGGDEWPKMSQAFSPDATLLAIGSTDNVVRLWNLESEENVVSLIGHESLITDVAFSADGQMVASGSADRTVRIWDVQTGIELQ